MRACEIERHAMRGQSEGNADLVGRVVPIEEVAHQTVDAIRSDQLYAITHHESREPICRRFQHIDGAMAELRCSRALYRRAAGQ